MQRTLKFHAKIDDGNLKICTIWIEDGGQAISNKASGMTVRDIEDFFEKHPSLMLSSQPYDFSTWLVTIQDEAVLIADDLAAYGELGLKFDIKSSADSMTSQEAE
jgi:hypothetical protein